MLGKLPFPKWACVTPIKVYLTELSEDGEPVESEVFDGKCIYSEKSRQIMDAERRLVQLNAKAIIEGDIARAGHRGLRDGGRHPEAGYPPGGPAPQSRWHRILDRTGADVMAVRITLDQAKLKTRSSAEAGPEMTAEVVLSNLSDGVVPKEVGTLERGGEVQIGSKGRDATAGRLQKRLCR